MVRDKLVSNEHIIIDSKSGVSGAGKRLETKYLFAELNENFFSYGIEKHKHIAEIDQELSKFGQNSFSFIPSLLPVTRGLQSTIYIDKKSDVSSYKSCLKDFYEKEHFIKILDKKPPSLKDVVNTNSLYKYF